MVAQGDHVRPGVEDGVSLAGVDAHARGVFPVDHHKSDAFHLFQGGQVAGEHLNAAVPYHVAYGKEVKGHTKASFTSHWRRSSRVGERWTLGQGSKASAGVVPFRTGQKSTPAFLAASASITVSPQ